MTNKISLTDVVCTPFPVRHAEPKKRGGLMLHTQHAELVGLEVVIAKEGSATTPALSPGDLVFVRADRHTFAWAKTLTTIPGEIETPFILVPLNEVILVETRTHEE